MNYLLLTKYCENILFLQYMYKIVLIGDSLTEWGGKENGWGKKMQDWYKDKASIVNEGYAGYNSKMIKDLIEHIVPKPEESKQILLCTILLGTNDCFFKGRQLSFQEYKANMLYIINHIHSLYPKTEILLITPPPSGFQILMTKYINALYEIKKIYPFVNIVNLHIQPNIILMTDLYDGVHFNDSGNNKLFKYVQNAIFYYYNHLIPSKL